MSTWGKHTHGYQKQWKLNPNWKRASQGQTPAWGTPAPPFGDLIFSIDKSDLSRKYNGDGDDLAITDCQTVTSFNWLEKKSSGSNIIIIPGKPPRWTPLTTATQLTDDKFTGQIYYRDKTAARFPKHPMEPTVVACLSATTSLESLLDVDIVACNKTLINLLDFVSGTEKLPSFRMLVEKVGDTVFLVRRENSPTERIHNIHGFGHTFPEGYTSWDKEVKESASNQRVVRYMLGGLRCLVRFEVDGYLPDNAELAKPIDAKRHSSGSSGSETAGSGTVDDLATMLAAGTTSIDSSPPLSPSSPSGPISITPAGSLVPQSQIFDIKTRILRSKYTKDCLGSQLPRLWLAQIPNFVLAYHDDGLFDPKEIHVSNVERDVSKWEGENGDAIAKFVAVLKRIVEAVSERDDGKVEVYFPGGEVAKLEIRKQLAGAGDVLSLEVREKWEALVTEKGSDGIDGGSDDRSSKQSQDHDGCYDHDSNTEPFEDEWENDFTACSAQDCGYCGKCNY